ncbi:unnamed protein product [Musa acuminata var. zebrina]
MAMDQNANACHSEPFNDNTYPCSILKTGFIPRVDTYNNVPLLILDWSMVLQMEADYHMQTMPILMSSMRNSTKECCRKGANCGRRPCYRGWEVVAPITGFYVLRHPRFRHKLPSAPINYFKRLPARTDSMF